MKAFWWNTFVRCSRWCWEDAWRVRAREDHVFSVRSGTRPRQRLCLNLTTSIHLLIPTCRPQLPSLYLLGGGPAWSDRGMMKSQQAGSILNIRQVVVGGLLRPRLELSSEKCPRTLRTGFRRVLKSILVCFPIPSCSMCLGPYRFYARSWPLQACGNIKLVFFSAEMLGWWEQCPVNVRRAPPSMADSLAEGTSHLSRPVLAVPYNPVPFHSRVVILKTSPLLAKMKKPRKSTVASRRRRIGLNSMKRRPGSYSRGTRVVSLSL